MAYESNIQMNVKWEQLVERTQHSHIHTHTHYMLCYAIQMKSRTSVSFWSQMYLILPVVCLPTNITHTHTHRKHSNEWIKGSVCVYAMERKRTAVIIIGFFLAFAIKIGAADANDQNRTQHAYRKPLKRSHFIRDAVVWNDFCSICHAIEPYRAISYALSNTHTHSSHLQCDDAVTSNKSITLAWPGLAYNKCFSPQRLKLSASSTAINRICSVVILLESSSGFFSQSLACN